MAGGLKCDSVFEIAWERTFIEVSEGFDGCSVAVLPSRRRDVVDLDVTLFSIW